MATKTPETPQITLQVSEKPKGPIIIQEERILDIRSSSDDQLAEQEAPKPIVLSREPVISFTPEPVINEPVVVSLTNEPAVLLTNEPAVLLTSGYIPMTSMDMVPTIDVYNTYSDISATLSSNIPLGTICSDDTDCQFGYMCKNSICSTIDGPLYRDVPISRIPETFDDLTPTPISSQLPTEAPALMPCSGAFADKNCACMMDQNSGLYMCGHEYYDCPLYLGENCSPKDKQLFRVGCDPGCCDIREGQNIDEQCQIKGGIIHDPSIYPHTPNTPIIVFIFLILIVLVLIFLILFAK